MDVAVTAVAEVVVPINRVAQHEDELGLRSDVVDAVGSQQRFLWVPALVLWHQVPACEVPEHCRAALA